MVRLRQRVVIVPDTDGTLDPPVRRVQGVGVVAAVVAPGRRSRPWSRARRRCRCGCGRPGRRGTPGSFQQTTSGNQRGTVSAMVPPGRSTRTSSTSAWMSAGTCSRISAATIRSNSPSAKGRQCVALLHVGLGTRRHLAGRRHRGEHVAGPGRARRRPGRGRRRRRRGGTSRTRVGRRRSRGRAPAPPAAARAGRSQR